MHATKWMKHIVGSLFLLMLAMSAGHGAVNIPGHLLDPGAPRIEDPERLVQVFLQAVDRGELTLFGRRIDRAMLIPQRVEYVYELSSRTTRAKIHARLKVPIPVPERKDCKVQSVSVVLDDGRIIETESHIWMEP